MIGATKHISETVQPRQGNPLQDQRLYAERQEIWRPVSNSALFILGWLHLLCVTLFPHLQNWDNATYR